MPCRPVTAADSVSWKSAGSFWMSAQVMPISVILIGSQLGHLKLAPSAAPMLRNTRSRLGDEGAVAEEREVAALAADHERPDGDLGAHCQEAHHLLVRRGAGVDVEVHGVQAEEGAEGDLSVSARKMKPLTLLFSNCSPTRSASVSGTPAQCRAPPRGGR